MHKMYHENGVITIKVMKKIEEENTIVLFETITKRLETQNKNITSIFKILIT